MIDENAATETDGEAVGSLGPPLPPPRKYPLGARLAVGTLVSFGVASLLYGPTTVLTMLFFATVCTVGIGLLLILAGCWLVGWLVLEIWSLVPRSGSATSGTAPSV